ncbi:hypothetical protein IWW38_002176 [Coemansia aciculifera]|uniref:Uncharacterized protein n=1 Tax=Coemansia aciculifera TaxID=417176 RepID=A0ACC1M4Y9_9FUNG|nr:hypothetical protein IWW38_002176 [Coemansia aciculifera]
MSSTTTGGRRRSNHITAAINNSRRHTDHATATNTNNSDSDSDSDSSSLLPADYHEGVVGYKKLAKACARQWRRVYGGKQLSEKARNAIQKVASLQAQDDDFGRHTESARIRHELAMANVQASAKHLEAMRRYYTESREELSTAHKHPRVNDDDARGYNVTLELLTTGVESDRQALRDAQTAHGNTVGAEKEARLELRIAKRMQDWAAVEGNKRAELVSAFVELLAAFEFDPLPASTRVSLLLAPEKPIRVALGKVPSMKRIRDNAPPLEFVHNP